MRLITDGLGNYSLLDDNNDVFASTMDSGLTDLKLDENQIKELSESDYFKSKNFEVDYITPDNVVIITHKDKSNKKPGE
jgi:hypothetical protein